MPSPITARIGLGIGGLMIAIGVFIGARSLLGSRAPLTGTLWLDLAFAFFFVARGALQLQRWQRARTRS
ncbi:MAG: hypothetical protein ABI910_22135 [Gemmatimonadota bacterium]